MSLVARRTWLVMLAVQVALVSAATLTHAQGAEAFEPAVRGPLEWGLKHLAGEAWERSAAHEAARLALGTELEASATQRVADALEARMDGPKSRVITAESVQAIEFDRPVKSVQETEKLSEQLSPKRIPSFKQHMLDFVHPPVTVRTARTIFVSNENSLRSELDEAIRTKASRPVVFRNSGRTIAEMERALDTKVKTIRVLESLPRNPFDAYLVHGEQSAQVAASSWRRITRQLEQTGLPMYSPTAERGAQTIAAKMAESLRQAPPSELQVLVGHVEDGKMIMADRSSLSVEELSEASSAPILFMGCNTLELIRVGTGQAHVGRMAIGAGDFINYDELPQTLGAIGELFHANESLRDLLLRFQQSDSELLNIFMGVVELLESPSRAGSRHTIHEGAA